MSDDWIELLAHPLTTTAAVEFVTASAAGGIAVFAGITRRETSHGRDLAALDYEVYADMAVDQMRTLVADARKQWPLVKTALLHRIGRVAVSEPSVVIAVSAEHRGPALQACAWMIDRLKSHVTIWKREMWLDGSTSWAVGMGVEPGKS